MKGPDRPALRREMRRRRRALSSADRGTAARAVAARIARMVHLRQGARIGAYLAAGSELDTGPLLELARRRGWHVYVPIVVHARSAQMRFAPLDGELRVNRFGIAEPCSHPSAWLAARWLDLVFVPLIAVGPYGERLGSGAGFYDRAFAHRGLRRTWHKPPLVGLAYECQRVPSLPLASWDIALDALITERAFYRIGGGR